MISFNSWPRLEQPIFKAIQFAMIEKFFNQSFWDLELQKWGPEAMRIWPLAAPRAYGYFSTFRWRQLGLRIGVPALRWIQDVATRTRWDDEHALLWQWLRQLTKLAVEPKACMIRWAKQQSEWKETDKLLWSKRNECKAKADQLLAYLQQLYNEIYSEIPLPMPLPPVEYRYFREAFAAMSQMHRALSHEISTYGIITVDYHNQRDPQTKADIQNFYAPNLRTRLDAIHIQIAADCIQFLDVFNATDGGVLLRISQNEQAVDLLDNERRVLREKFVAIQHAIRPIRLSFDANPQAYVYNLQDFPYVKPVTAQDTAKRIEKLAKQQLHKLSGSLLTIAQGWINILARGERLANAAEGSEDAALNARLTNTVNWVNAVKQRHQMEMAQRYPHSAENMLRMLRNPNLLQPNQVMPDAGMRAQRFNMMAAPGQINPWQTVYAEASGFVPYRDPRTGLTRFYRANIPTEAGPSVNPMAAAQAQAQGQNLVAALAPGPAPGFAPGGNVQPPGGQFPGGQPQPPADPDASFRHLMQGLGHQSMSPSPPAGGASSVDAMRALIDERGRQVQANPGIAGHVVPSIYNRALQTVAGPNGASLVNNNVPGANSLFGRSAAQNSMANQQMEALIRQSALGVNPYATPGNMAAQQQGGIQAPGAGFAPANQLYDPVGGNAFQAAPPAIPTPSQNPFAPGGGSGGPSRFPPPMAPAYPPQGGYQGPDVFRPPMAPPPQGGFQGQQQGFPPQVQFPPQGAFQGQQQYGPPTYIPPRPPMPPPGGNQGQ